MDFYVLTIDFQSLLFYLQFLKITALQKDENSPHMLMKNVFFFAFHLDDYFNVIEIMWQLCIKHQEGR